MFVRRQTDGVMDTFDLRNLYAGPRSSCWIVGGGPSLDSHAAKLIAASPAPVFTMNLAGSGLLRPNFWTSYDPTDRFHRSIYLDASIIKFVHHSRAMDLVPETTWKVCDCPGTLFFERNREVGFHDFPARDCVTDWQDSFIQAIHIAFLLGFRKLYLAGCELFIEPGKEWKAAATAVGVKYESRSLLSEFVKSCEAASLPQQQLATFGTAKQYHFEETKDFQAAINTDFHYFRVAQSLRLSRRSLADKGLQLISTTPISRLNDDFPYQSVESALADLQREVGNIDNEPTVGLYSQPQSRHPAGLGPMRDFRPHFWKAERPTANAGDLQPPQENDLAAADECNQPQNKTRQSKPILPPLPEIAVDLREQI